MCFSRSPFLTFNQQFLALILTIKSERAAIVIDSTTHQCEALLSVPTTNTEFELTCKSLVHFVLAVGSMEPGSQQAVAFVDLARQDQKVQHVSISWKR